MNPNYYGIIPAPVRYSSVLSANAKLLFSELTALSSKEGYCWATNSYFSELYGVEPRSVSDWVSQLHNAGFIKVEVNQEEGNTRKIWVAIPIIHHRSREKSPDPYGEKTQHTINNTSINNTSIYSVETEKEENSRQYSEGAHSILKAMIAVDPKNKLNLHIPAHLKAAAFLEREYGLGAVLGVIKALPVINTMNLYVGQATTTIQLMNNWVSIKNDLQKKKQGDSKNKLIV